MYEAHLIDKAVFCVANIEQKGHSCSNTEDTLAAATGETMILVRKDCQATPEESITAIVVSSIVLRSGVESGAHDLTGRLAYINKPT